MNELRDMLATLSELAQIDKQVAPLVGAEVKRFLLRSIEAGQDPMTGQAWAVRKRDGAKALQNASAQLRVTTVGRSVYAVIGGPEARHNFGDVTGGTIRRILPNGEVPDALTKDITRVVTEVFKKVTGL